MIGSIVAAIVAVKVGVAAKRVLADYVNLMIDGNGNTRPDKPQSGPDS